MPDNNLGEKAKKSSETKPVSYAILQKYEIFVGILAFFIGWFISLLIIFALENYLITR